MTNLSRAEPMSRLQMAATAYLVIAFGGANFLFLDGDGRAATNPLYAGIWGVVCVGVGLALLRDMLVERSFPLDTRGLLFAAIPLLSTIWSIEPGSTAFYGGSFTVGVLSGALLAVRLAPAAFLTSLLRAVQVLAIASLLLLLLWPQRAIYHDFMARQSYLGFPAIEGVMPHKNIAAVAYAVGIALLAGRRRSMRPAIFVGWLAGFAIMGLATGSALFPVLLALIGLAVSSPVSRTRRLILPVFILIVVIASLAASGVDRLAPDWLYKALGRSSELTGRTSIWAIGVHLVSERPWLGYGFEAAFRSDALYRSELVHEFGWYRPPHAHNSYLQAAISVGLPGAAAMFAALGAALAGVGRSALPDRRAARLVTLSIAILIFCVAGASENVLMQYNGAFAILVGALMTYVRTPAARAAPQPLWTAASVQPSLGARP
jgi:exopolysaccharide production protein ExoQ